MLIDCHVHLDSYSDQEVGEVLERAAAVGVEFVISAGTTLDSTRRSIELSKKYERFFSGVGIHPMDISEPFAEQTYTLLYDLAIDNEKVIVMSEIGLDFMEGTPERSMQYHAFREQIRLARELNLPIVFHSREAHAEVFRLLKEERAYEVGGVMHYFQGTDYEARSAIDLGFHISLARPLLRLPELQKVASGLPLEWIVLETDAAPQPFRAKRESWTEPRYLRPIVEKLAELQKKPVDEVERVTADNILRVLGERVDLISKYVTAVSAAQKQEQ